MDRVQPPPEKAAAASSVDRSTARRAVNAPPFEKPEANTVPVDRQLGAQVGDDRVHEADVIGWRPR